MAAQTRRGFLNGLFVAIGGAAVAISPLGLVGCAGESDDGTAPESTDPSLQTMAVERVTLRPGMRYANVMPRYVPAVRKLAASRAALAL